MTEEKKMLFSQDALKKLLWPLIIEQFLAIAMGMADTVMAASCGEAVVSGISLVDSICVLLIGLFTAMASGGAVVAAQYMGHGDKEMVGRASNQLFIAVGGVALLFMTIALIWNKGLLALLYGNVEADVMNAARIYFYIVAVSFIKEYRLKSRFEWGLIADISIPDYETRLAILRKKAQTDNIIVDDVILSTIATRVASNIRELEGVFNKLVAFSTLANGPITIEMAEKAINDISAQKEKVISADYIQDVVVKKKIQNILFV